MTECGSVGCVTQVGSVLSGLDVEIEKGCPNLTGKRVGLVCNHTTITRDRKFAVDALREKGVNIVRLFGPEHGVRGDMPAGETIGSGTDAATGIPVTSLYGRRIRPSEEELKELDVLVYDIQDVGVRFYTYIWTLHECMVAAADVGVPFIVLDRPGIVGSAIEGNVLDEEFSSFVGKKALAWRFAMTIGELARLYNDAGWMDGGKRLDLTVVPLEGYRRDMWQEDTGLPWVLPSPNLPTPESCVHYPGTCLFEGTSSLTEARGTDKPFQYVGAPFIDGATWAKRLAEFNLPGVRFEPIKFTPMTIPGKVNHPKFEDEKCQGVRLVCTDRSTYRPVKASIVMLKTLIDMYPGKVVFRDSHFDHLAGTDNLRHDLLAGKSVDDIMARLESSLEPFLKMREKALLYK